VSIHFPFSRMEVFLFGFKTFARKFLPFETHTCFGPFLLVCLKGSLFKNILESLFADTLVEAIDSFSILGFLFLRV